MYLGDSRSPSITRRNRGIVYRGLLACTLMTPVLPTISDCSSYSVCTIALLLLPATILRKWDSSETTMDFAVGTSVPVFTNGLIKAAWSRRDSRSINNSCDKYALGYQDNFTKQVYVYGDIAHIHIDSGGTCPIAYTNEQTTIDLRSGDARGDWNDG